MMFFHAASLPLTLRSAQKDIDDVNDMRKSESEPAADSEHPEDPEAASAPADGGHAHGHEHNIWKVRISAPLCQLLSSSFIAMIVLCALLQRDTC